MKYMGWSWEQYVTTPSPIVMRIAELAKEEADRQNHAKTVAPRGRRR